MFGRVRCPVIWVSKGLGRDQEYHQGTLSKNLAAELSVVHGNKGGRHGVDRYPKVRARRAISPRFLVIARK